MWAYVWLSLAIVSLWIRLTTVTACALAIGYVRFDPEWSILTHFLVNLTHILCFTYAAVQGL